MTTPPGGVRSPSDAVDRATAVAHVRAAVTQALHTAATGSVSVSRASLLLCRSERERKLARKWPWPWTCNLCDDGYGAGKTEAEAREYADQHLVQAHPEAAQALDRATEGDR